MDNNKWMKKVNEFKNTNEKQRNIENNFVLNNKGILQTISNIQISDENDIVEKLSQPTRKKKTKAMQTIDNKYTSKGKIYSGDYGLINPTKLNISSETLDKINKK